MPASNYSVELQEVVCQRVRNGEHPASAAQACGIPSSTHHDWMKREKAPYSDYSEAIKRARAEAEASHIKNIKKAAEDGKWQASAWWLERNMPERYGKQVSIEDAMKVLVKELLAGNEDVTRALRAAVSQAANQPSV